MYYTQIDKRRYHYISDPEFERLFDQAEEWDYAESHPDWALRTSKDKPQLKRFGSGDDVRSCSGDWEMTATLYGWSENSQVLEVAETLYREDGKNDVERRWFVIELGKEEEE